MNKPAIDSRTHLYRILVPILIIRGSVEDPDARRTRPKLLASFATDAMAATGYHAAEITE